MDSRSESIGLQAGLAVQRDNGAVGQRPVLAEQNPFFVDNADSILRDDDGSEENTQNNLVKDHDENKCEYPSVPGQQANR